MSSVHPNMTDTPSLGGLPPPPGVIPNFINPESQRSQLVAIIGICLFLTSFFVCIRLYTVFRVLKSHGWADCECCPSV